MSDTTPPTTPEQTDPPKRAGRLPSGFTTLRDLLTFGFGMVIIGHEVFWSDKAEPAAIAIGVTLSGLPLVFGADERRKP